MKTLFTGQNCIHLKSVNSTNSYAIELLRQNAPPEGTLIYTFDQQNGRGQRGNSWSSQPNKNATLSYVFHPSFLRIEKQFLLTKICSLAVADLMTEIVQQNDIKQHESTAVCIKWPNDIYIGNKKIAGILIENTLREHHINYSVIGIGININQTEFDSDINATSLALITSREHEIMPIINRLSEYLEARYLQLKADKYEIIDKNYLEKLYQLNNWKKYQSGNEVFNGKITNVSAIGKLQIQLESGETKEYDLKEIRFL